MSPVIVIDLNLFALEIPVVLIESNGMKTQYNCQMSVLSNFIAELATNSQTNKVYIYSSKERGIPVAEQISLVANTRYSNNNLEIEVITR